MEEGGEQLVKATASEAIEKYVIVCSRAVTWRDEVDEAVGARRKADARYTPNETTTGW